MKIDKDNLLKPEMHNLEKRTVHNDPAGKL